MNYLFRYATKSDITSIFKLYENRIKWMDKKGLKQWNTTDYLRVYPLDYFQKQLEDKHLYIIEDIVCNKIIGAAVLLHKDIRWDNAEAENAYYIHNLVTDICRKGIGKIILKEIENLALSEQKTYIRLDCSVDNAFLNNYYEALEYFSVGQCKDGLYIGIKREKKLL